MGIFRQFPYSNFHEMNMDEIIKIMREMQDEWTATKAEWASYKDFIDNYFATLDLSEEVLAAIRRMAADGSLNTVIDPVIATETAAWLAAHISATAGETVIDKSLSVDNAAADALSAGTRIQSVNNEADVIADNVNIKTIHVTNLISGYYDQATGIYHKGSYKTAGMLLPIENEETIFLSGTEYNVSLCCYDENKEFLGYRTIKNDPHAVIFQATFPGTKYVAPTILNANADEIILIPITDFHVAEYPYNNNQCLICYDHVARENGVATNSNFDVILVPVNEGDIIFTNRNFVENAYGFDYGDQPLGSLERTVSAAGNLIIEIPEGVNHVRFNVYHNDLHGGVQACVIYKLDKPEKILAIGDSITWLNGRGGGYDDSGAFMGWQLVINKAGYRIDSAGYNGKSYANRAADADSIYKNIVTDEYDVSDYDIIILLGGLNDELYDVPLGTENNSWINLTNTDPNTFNGALAGIIQYIRENNTKCNIILCTTIYTEATQRPYPEVVTYNNAIKHNAELFGCYLYDIAEKLNITPFTNNFDANHYDNTHLNKKGMKKLGVCMLKAVEEYTV